jgi:predicted nucleotide-binding protein
VQNKFLLISDTHDLKGLKEALALLGSLEVRTEDEARKNIVHQHYDLILVDATSVEEFTKLIAYIREHSPNIKTVVVTASPSWPLAREAFRAGAVDYIDKTLSPHKLLMIFTAILKQLSRATTTIPHGKEGRHMRTPTILFADNDQDFLDARKDFLLQEGYQVLLATDPITARQFLLKERIDLAILDIRLVNDDDDHDISGILLARDVAPRVPKIMLTAFPSVETARRAFSALFPGEHVVDYIAKKEEQNVLLSAVHVVLSRPKIFLVHGHDDDAKEMVARFLEKGGPRVIVLHEQPMVGMTIIEKFEYYADDIDFAVVLLTPDDVGGKSKDKVNPRARQNVILELGYFMAKLGRANVVPLYKENVEIPSELAGILPIPIDSHNGWKLALTREIQSCGIDFDLAKAVI